jgi:vacuolar-type H+-ATPase subunit I/STV1
MSGIKEKDWRTIRALKNEKLNAVCADILNEINQEISNKEEQNHKAYLKVWEIVNTRDKDVADMFNDLRRSNAIYKLALWYKNGYLTEKELNEFSEETRSTINALCN